MILDSEGGCDDGYLTSLKRFQHLMGYKTLREAEVDLYPVRAAKRRMKIIERIELEATTEKGIKELRKIQRRRKSNVR